MGNIKKGVKRQLRFNTNKGVLSIEGLYQLKRSSLKLTLIALSKLLKEENNDNLSFLDDEVKVDDELQLKFEIVKEIYLEKKEEEDYLANQNEVKKHNAEIDMIIAEKKVKERRELSIEELKKLKK